MENQNQTSVLVRLSESQVALKGLYSEGQLLSAGMNQISNGLRTRFAELNVGLSSPDKTLVESIKAWDSEALGAIKKIKSEHASYSSKRKLVTKIFEDIKSSFVGIENEILSHVDLISSCRKIGDKAITDYNNEQERMAKEAMNMEIAKTTFLATLSAEVDVFVSICMSDYLSKVVSGNDQSFDAAGAVSLVIEKVVDKFKDFQGLPEGFFDQTISDLPDYVNARFFAKFEEIKEVDLSVNGVDLIKDEDVIRSEHDSELASTLSEAVVKSAISVPAAHVVESANKRKNYVCRLSNASGLPLVAQMFMMHGLGEVGTLEEIEKVTVKKMLSVCANVWKATGERINSDSVIYEITETVVNR